ncbi:hypothetical protein H6G81_01915 [Scytonema hofmannii FACHB-248]|uniref:Secreted protein n=1 Tax=Scytonema hofmannii FACHB-248 TaxID=1842502 RepID=A0ABR8GKQ3_9CYAN|nr:MULTISPECIES: hypothetical protein [Nostocales]MBD2603313.1 hypothetical protein [Scytonema hofmannii FACHB-248]
MINKRKIAFVASSLGFLGFTVGATFIAPQAVNAQAQLFNDFGCGVFDGNGNSVFADGNTKSVITGNGNNTILQCQGQVTPPSDGNAVIQKGFPCGTFLGLTYDSMSVVSANGNSTLTCHINNNKNQ